MSPRDVIRADLTADVLATAGDEERFPWRLAPIRALAIIATVGLGAPMGTESPAAHLGVSAGVWLGDRSRWWRRLARPAGVGGGAAGVSALIGIPLVGTAFILELGRRRRVPLSAERVAAALVGGFAGCVINVTFDLDLIRLHMPRPGDSRRRHGRRRGRGAGRRSTCVPPSCAQGRRHVRRSSSRARPDAIAAGQS